MTVRVQTSDFDVGRELAALRGGDRRVGAVAAFVGTVRDVNDDATVATLTLEHYPGMTEKALAAIVDEAKARWYIVDALVIHRVGALGIVPGIADQDDAGVPDVMRGEETQLIGAVAGDASPTLVVLPGTHSKWAIVRDGTIETFATYMTGEVYALLREHSILGRMEERGPARPFAAAAFARGVRSGLADGGSAGTLLHRLFGARTLALRADLAPKETGDYLSGLLIGSEVAAGRDWARTHALNAEAALVVGSRALCERYAAALQIAGVAVEAGHEHAAARGLWRIARAASLVP